ncbi:hypothetical protein ACIO93_29820 [Streptomyces sp. NPDC087903]
MAPRTHDGDQGEPLPGKSLDACHHDGAGCHYEAAKTDRERRRQIGGR